MENPRGEDQSLTASCFVNHSRIILLGIERHYTALMYWLVTLVCSVAIIGALVFITGGDLLL